MNLKQNAINRNRLLSREIEYLKKKGAKGILLHTYIYWIHTDAMITDAEIKDAGKKDA